MKSFDIPEFYRSDLIGKVKSIRKQQDPRKQDFSPSVLDFGNVQFYIARHFGFCYGVENAIEICYKALAENPGKRIYLLSQMIHNPSVNADLQDNGIDFIMDTAGNQLIPWEQVTSDDIVVIPAFGTTLEIEELLLKKGIETQQYNTTCPFVEKVWNRAAKLGESDYSIIIHGKHNHEETRATFSHSSSNAPALVIKGMDEAKIVGEFIDGTRSMVEFESIFGGRYSEGFDPAEHLKRFGVVNQTTMLATETQAIADYLKNIIISKYGADSYKDHFADTRDTLCYATNDNQRATQGLVDNEVDLAIVVGGYNSSNTSHIVELLEEKYPTYFIRSEAEIEENGNINHFDYENSKHLKTEEFLPAKRPLRIALTSGASCPDAVVNRVLDKLLMMTGAEQGVEEAMEAFTAALP